MTPKDKQNVAYWRQRYKSRERELEITPDLATIELEVVETRMGDVEGEKKSKEDQYSHLLLKAVQDLSKNIKEMGH